MLEIITMINNNKIITEGDKNIVNTGDGTINLQVINNSHNVSIGVEAISKKSDSITKLIHFLSENLPSENNNTNISRVAKTEKKMKINKLNDILRKEIRENYGNISSVVTIAFSNSDNFSEDKIMYWIKSLYIKSANIYDNSMEIWNDVHEEIYSYIISHNKDKLIEDYAAEHPINCLLIYAFVKCKLLKNPEENNDTE